jgi:tripartite-type tricarboxylate transporter receptor subunit TctC
MKIAKYLAALTLTAALAVPFAARAEYPEKPITVVIPLGAGGSHDLHARGITSIMSDIIGQPMVVKLVPGGAGMKGTTMVATGPADGYTLIFTHNAFDQLTPQTRKVEFDPAKAFKSVARINQAEPLLVIRANAPYKTFDEFIAYAKKNPGKINFGHSGVWGVSFMPTMQLIKDTGIKVNLVPHQGGGPTLRALLAGEDDAHFGFATQTRPHQKAGKVIAIAIAGDQRLKDDPDFKDVKSMAELGHPKVGFTMERIFMVPAGVPDDRVAKLRKAFDELVKNKSFATFIKSIGEKVDYMNGADYDKKRQAQITEYKDLIKEVGSK